MLVLYELVFLFTHALADVPRNSVVTVNVLYEFLYSQCPLVLLLSLVAAVCSSLLSLSDEVP